MHSGWISICSLWVYTSLCGAHNAICSELDRCFISVRVVYSIQRYQERTETSQATSLVMQGLLCSGVLIHPMEWCNAVGAWPGGTYWHTTHQPPDQLSYIEQSWAHFQHAFANELETMVAARDDVDTQRFTTTVKRLASWLRQQAPKLASQAHLVQHDGTVSDSAYASLLHGDPKASNFFFRLSGKDRDVACQPPILVPPSTAEGVCGVEVGLIDFQWTGYGLPGTDVAYCIATCVAEDFPLGDDAAVATVMELVRWYHTATLAAFVELGTTSSVAEGEALFPWAELKRQFVAGWLDLAKTVIADHWQTITPDMMRARKGKLVFNAYNKSVRIAMWFVKVTCDLVGAAGPG
eukprot:m.720996 g.720996  ORF g.720996 m.720996 type:complete len:351 (-) comp23011_c0_seq2:245-1297(-)